jgi:hypothetical protein
VIRGSQLWTCPLVRYRFDSAADLERHLRLAAAFFLPWSAPVAPGDRVAVELVLPEGDAPLVHGTVISRSRSGVYLQAPSARAAARWQPDVSAPRRRHRRFACGMFVEVQPPGAQPWLCRAIDLSEGGVRLATGSFEAGIAGDEVKLTLLSPGLDMPSVELPARLSWAGSREAGLSLSPSESVAALAHALEAGERESIELVHSEGCACVGARAAGQRQP